MIKWQGFFSVVSQNGTHLFNVGVHLVVCLQWQASECLSRHRALHFSGLRFRVAYEVAAFEALLFYPKPFFCKTASKSF
jgi:hypothetical protein